MNISIFVNNAVQSSFTKKNKSKIMKNYFWKCVISLEILQHRINKSFSFISSCLNFAQILLNNPVFLLFYSVSRHFSMSLKVIAVVYLENNF